MLQTTVTLYCQAKRTSEVSIKDLNVVVADNSGEGTTLDELVCTSLEPYIYDKLDGVLKEAIFEFYNNKLDFKELKIYFLDEVHKNKVCETIVSYISLQEKDWQLIDKAKIEIGENFGFKIKIDSNSETLDLIDAWSYTKLWNNVASRYLVGIKGKEFLEPGQVFVGVDPIATVASMYEKYNTINN